MGCCCCCWLWVGLIALVLYFVRRFLASRSCKLPVSGDKPRAIVITGCDTGFGRSAALEFASGKNGSFTVYAACLLEKSLAGLNSEGKGKIKAFQMNVADEESVKAGAKYVQGQEPGGIWAIINNAGILRFGPIELMDMESVRAQYEVNVFGTVACCKYFYNQVRKTKGRIVNVASVAGRVSLAGAGAYNGTKHAVEGISDALRRESFPWGVKVIMIEPGVIPTPLYDVPLSPERHEQFWNSMTKEQQEAYGREYFETSHEKGKQMLNKLGANNTADMVANAMVDAVTSRYPLTRYMIGKDTWVWLAFTYLPSWVVDGIVWQGQLKDKTLPKLALQEMEQAEAKKKK